MMLFALAAPPLLVSQAMDDCCLPRNES